MWWPRPLSNTSAAFGVQYPYARTNPNRSSWLLFFFSAVLQWFPGSTFQHVSAVDAVVPVDIVERSFWWLYDFFMSCHFQVVLAFGVLYHSLPCICEDIFTPYSKCMALTYFFRGGCAIYLTVKQFNPKFTQNSKCARRWRNPTSAKWAKLRHLPHF